jgi:hypothetical protein
MIYSALHVVCLLIYKPLMYAPFLQFEYQLRYTISLLETPVLSAASSL